MRGTTGFQVTIKEDIFKCFTTGKQVEAHQCNKWGKQKQKYKLEAQRNRMSYSSILRVLMWTIFNIMLLRIWSEIIFEVIGNKL